MAEAPKKLELKPSKKAYPWYGNQNQEHLNALHQNVPLLHKVPRHKYFSEIVLKPKRKLIKPNGIYGRFTVSNEEPSVASASATSVASSSPSISSLKPNGRYGRFTVSNEEPSVASASSAAASIPAPNIKPRRTFEVSNSSNGGRRTRKHPRRNISRRRRHVGRRRTHRNGA